MLMNLLAAFAGLFLFWMRPQDREYLWFGIYELLTGLDHLVLDYYRFHPAPEWIIFVAGCSFLGGQLAFVPALHLHHSEGAKELALLGRRSDTSCDDSGAAGIQDGVDRPGPVRSHLGACPGSLLLLHSWSLVPESKQRRARRTVDADTCGFCYLCWLAVILLTALGGSGHTWVYRDFHWFFEVSRPTLSIFGQ